MASLPDDVVTLLRRQRGVAARRQLIDAGLSRHQIDAMCADGNLVGVLKGVYHHAIAPLDDLARCIAVTVARPDTVVAGPTAGRIWGLRRVPRTNRVYVIGPPASNPTIAPWVVTYRTAAIHDVDRVRRPNGLVVTSRARTALDLSRFVGDDDLLSIIEQSIADGCSIDALRRVAVDWMSPRRPWLRRFLLQLDRRLRGGAADSHPEVLLGDRLGAAGVRGLERQFCIDLPGYGPARFDLAVPELRWAIEIDVHPSHHDLPGRRRDEWRDRAAGELDWSVTRVGPEGFGPALDQTLAALVAEHRERTRGAHR